MPITKTPKSEVNTGTNIKKAEISQEPKLKMVNKANVSPEETPQLDPEISGISVSTRHQAQGLTLTFLEEDIICFSDIDIEPQETFFERLIDDMTLSEKPIYDIFWDMSHDKFSEKNWKYVENIIFAHLVLSYTNSHFTTLIESIEGTLANAPSSIKKRILNLWKIHAYPANQSREEFIAKAKEKGMSFFPEETKETPTAEEFANIFVERKSLQGGAIFLLQKNCSEEQLLSLFENIHHIFQVPLHELDEQEIIYEAETQRRHLEEFSLLYGEKYPNLKQKIQEILENYESIETFKEFTQKNTEKRKGKPSREKDFNPKANIRKL